MHIDTANLHNLTQLLQRYGALSLYEDDNLQLQKNISWPNRIWANMALPATADSLVITAKNAPEGARFPLWPAMTEDGSAATQASVDALVHQSQDWQPIFQHTAMALQFDKHQLINNQTVAKPPLHFKRLSEAADIAAWVDTGSKAFGYAIDSKVILQLLVCEDIQILLAYNEDSQPVATGLLFKTGNVVGIHQIGVPADHQGRGYASQMMRYLIHSAKNWQADHIVLQASEAGRPVYQKLGFIDQFKLTYLQRNKN